MIDERTLLASEVAELKRIIAEIPARRLLERMSFESRLEDVQERLAALPENPPKSAPVRLTFGGKPVNAREGISASFGGEALGIFSDLFAAIAAGYSDVVQAAGPLPKRHLNRLMITGTAVGSFGFVLELPQQPESSSNKESDQISFISEQDEMELVPTPEDAIRAVEDILRVTVEGSDDEVMGVLSEVNERAIKYAHKFLNLLVENEATCGLKFERRTFKFHSVQQIRNAAERIKLDNIQTGERTFVGHFSGVLPRRRTFEFILSSGDKRVLYGKIDPSIDSPKEVRDWQDKPVTVRLQEMRVGQGNPRYKLVSLDDVQPLEEA